MAPTDPPAPDQTVGEMPFLGHLLELRDRLLRMVLAVLGGVVILLPFANRLYSYLAEPLLRHMPAGATMIATEVASPFLAPFKLALVAAVFLAMPVILYQAWAFIAPGLYQKERRFALPLLVSSILLFYLGMAFAYYVVFPIIFGFFTATAPEGVTVMTDISKYLDFVLTLFFAFGVAFEVPIAVLLLIWTGFTTVETLTRIRPYFIVGAFVVGMVITPPDVFSQTFVALPMVVLFEAGIFLARVTARAQAKREAEAEARAGAHPVSRIPAITGPATGAESETTDTGEGTGTSSGPGEPPVVEDDIESELDQAIAEETALNRQPPRPADPA
ncbi:MAG: twin-arginine translocase subunit TatC [Gammaproteobacteria bacterium]|nr:twin-arginine translocase subunit TatC [Gammaproteobacteria bacterium]